MPLSLSEKILARASGRARLQAGDIVVARVDRAMTYDPFAGELGRRFRRRWGEGAHIWDPERLVLVADHFLDLDQPRHRELQEELAAFAAAAGVRHFYPVGAEGNYGICHALLPEEGLVRPGELIAGTDSHSCTYGGFGAIGLGIGLDAMEGILAVGQYWIEVPPVVRIEIAGTFPADVHAKDVILTIARDHGMGRGLLGAAVELDGEAVQALHPEEKLTLANMAAELGARWLVVPPNDAVIAWVAALAPGAALDPLQPDPDASYARVIRYRGADFRPVVARPGAPDDVVTVETLPETRFNEVFVGSCTGAKRFDLETFFGRLIEAGGVADGVTLQVVPATRRTRDWMVADEGRVALLAAENVELAEHPGCNACFGGHGFLAWKDSVRFSTSNRNFPGRMGAVEAKVWLGSPALAAGIAATGRMGRP